MSVPFTTCVLAANVWCGCLCALTQSLFSPMLDSERVTRYQLDLFPADFYGTSAMALEGLLAIMSLVRAVAAMQHTHATNRTNTTILVSTVGDPYWFRRSLFLVVAPVLFAQKHVHELHLILSTIVTMFSVEPLKPRLDLRSVLRAVSSHVPEGCIATVVRTLPPVPAVVENKKKEDHTKEEEEAEDDGDWDDPEDVEDTSNLAGAVVRDFGPFLHSLSRLFPSSSSASSSSSLMGSPVVSTSGTPSFPKPNPLVSSLLTMAASGPQWMGEFQACKDKYGRLKALDNLIDWCHAQKHLILSNELAIGASQPSQPVSTPTTKNNVQTFAACIATMPYSAQQALSWIQDQFRSHLGRS